MPAAAQSSNLGLVYVGRIVKPDGTALTDSSVQFLIQLYGRSTLLGDGSAGTDRCLLYQETQTLDMSNSVGTFNLVVGEGSAPLFGVGVTSLVTVIRNPQNNSPVASEAIGAISCSSGQTQYLSSTWDNDREINVTVTTSSTVLHLATMPIRSVPYALQATQLGGYSSDYMFRVQGSRPGSNNNFSVNQFDFLKNIGINAVTPGTPSTYQVTNLLADDPTVAHQVATKNYVDTAVSSVATSQPALADAKLWVGNSSNAATAVSVSGDATMSDTGALTLASTGVTSGTYSQVTVDTKGRVTSAANPAPSLPTLTDSKLWVGNAGNIATAVSAGGDVAMTNAGLFTVSKIQNTAVSATAPTSGQVLQYDGAAWTPTTNSYQTTALTDAKLWVGNSSNVATAVSVSGDAAIADTGALTLASTGVTSGTYSQVTVDAKGRVTSAANPTTLAGYGITDAIKNAGGTPNIYSGAAQPGAPQSGELYVDTINKKIQRYNGASWDDLGTPGAVTSVAASSPLQSSGGATPTISLANQNANLVLAGPSSGGAAAPGFRLLAAADIPSAAGDVSGAYSALSVDKIKGTAVSATAPTSGQVLQYNGAAWAPTTNSYQTTALTDAKLWVGNSSNVATAVSVSGDASIADTGALTLNTVPTTKGGTGVTSYNLGEIPVYDGTKLTGLGCSIGQVLQWSAGTGFGCVTMTGVSPVGSSLTSGKVWVGNSSNVAAAVSVSGDASMDSAGLMTVGKIQSTAVSATAPTSGQVLQYNGAAWAPITLNYLSPTLTQNNVWLGNASNLASPLAMPTCAANYYLTFDGTSFSCALDAGATGSVTSLATTSPLATSGATGNITLSMNLNSGHIYVGNASNLAADVSMSGDASVSNTGALTLASTGVTAGTYSQVTVDTKGRVTSAANPAPSLPTLTDSKLWVGNAGNVATAVSAGGDVTMTNAGLFTVSKIQNTAVSATAPTSGQVLQYNGAAWTPTTNSYQTTALTDAKLWVGNSSNVATAVSVSGDASVGNTGALTLASTGVTAGTYSQVTVDAKGRVTSAANPTTLAGYGITDAIKNAGGTPSVAEGLFASIPAAGTAGRIYVATDSKVIYRDNGVSWDGMGSAGAVTSVAASSPLQSSGGATPTISLANQNANLVLAGPSSGGAAAPGFRSLAAADIPSAAGDVSGAYSALSVDKIKGTAVSATAPTSGQVLQYNGAAWTPTTNSYQTTALTDAKLWVGNSSNIAAAVSVSGDAAIADTGALTLASTGVTAGTYSQVTVDAKGRVTSAANPTTLAGYGITDAIKNAGGTPNIYSGAAQPGAPQAGELYVDTTNKKIQRYNGASWDDLGTPGAVTSVAASSPLQSSGGATPTISLANQNANLVLAGPSSGGAAAPGFRSLAAADFPSAAGDVSGAYSALSVDKIKGTTVSATAPTSGQVLQYNGAAWAPTTNSYQSTTLTDAKLWVGNSSNVATAVSVSGDAAIADTGALTLNTVPTTKGGTGVTSYNLGEIPVYDGTKLTGLGCSIGQVLQWSAGTGFGCVTMTGVSPVGSSLTSGKVWVGNASNLAAAVSVSGDITLASTGAATVSGLQGQSVAATTPTSGQVLSYNGTVWTPAAAPTGTGTTNYLARWSAASALTSSLIYDDGTHIGIGTSSPQAGLDIATTGTGGSAMIVPRDTVGNRPATPINGMIRYNSTDNVFEVYENGAWSNMIKGYLGGITLVGKANCKWTVTTSWSTMSANVNCNTPTTDGSAISPGNLPAIKFANLAPGRYKVTFNVAYENASGVCLYRITDGTNYAGFAHTSSINGDYLSGDFYYSTAQSNVTFSMQAKADTANDCYIHGDAALTGMAPVSDFVYKFYVEKI